jgi:phage tail sheath protein FI
MWFNGLTARGFLLGGRVDLLKDDNPVTDLIDGIARLRTRITPPPPWQTAEFILEYDVSYLQTLFATS